jgi:hypothetical protein
MVEAEGSRSVRGMDGGSEGGAEAEARTPPARTLGSSGVVSGVGWVVGRRWLKRAGQSVGGIGDATTSEWWCGGYWRRDMASVRVGAGAGAGVWPLLEREREGGGEG